MTNTEMSLEALKAQYGDLVDEQLVLETTFKQEAEQRMTTSFDRIKAAGQAGESSLAQRYIDYRFDSVQANMKALVEDTIRPKRGVKPAYLYLIRQLAEIYAGQEDHLYGLMTISTMSSIFNGVMRKEHRLTNLASAAVNNLQQEAKLEAFLKANPDTETSIAKGISERIRRQYKVFYANRRMQHTGDNWAQWELSDALMLGCKMVEMAVVGSGYFEERHETDHRGDGVAMIMPTQELMDAWTKSESNMMINAFRLVPCCIPPRDWVDFSNGGYWGALANSSTLLRLHRGNGGADNIFNKQYLARLNQLELTEVRTAVNALQQTPWVINQKVLEVAKILVKRGGGMAGLPLMDKLPEIPELTGEFTEEELKLHKKKIANRHRLDGRRVSQTYRVRAHLEIAEKYKGFDKIYFPWNMDFRGRCYPIPSFSPQGDDLNKGLLLFADAPECQTMEDIEWMMIHGANLAGIDKVSFTDRVQWIKDNEKAIMATAADPLAHIGWWGSLDCPMQFLGFCFEWSSWKAYEAVYGTPKGFKTGLVVAFDGTCSGLQHFSAILRDSIGGAAVNLLPADKPQDIYAVVAEKVNVMLKRDALNGTMDEEVEGKKGTYTKYGTKYLAQEWLNYGVTRKVTKREVMTLAYGAKQYGFKYQLLEDIIRPAQDEAGEDKVLWIHQEQAAAYLAKLIWDAVSVTVVKAVEGMKWLQDMAKMVCKGGHTVLWETPMGLPVMQAYMENNSETIRIRFGSSFKRLYSNKSTGKIHKSHQTSGIAPNFIHSMDASHLQLTIMMAKEAGINHFAMIHDSYGAPVAQAGLMFKTVRQAFIKMYSENDVLGKFKEDMMVYIDKNADVPAIPTKGTLNLNTIMDSLYTFH